MAVTSRARSKASPPDRRTRRRRETKAEIIEAAWALVRENGLAALAMRDLGEQVGMKAQSLYSYFGSKLDIYDAMFEQAYVDFAELIEDTSARLPESGAEALRYAAHMFFDFCTSDPVRYQLLFQRTIPAFVPSDDSYAVAVSAYQAMTARMEALGITDEGAIDLWTALLTGLASQQISNDPGGDRWERIVDRSVDMFIRESAPHLLVDNSGGTQP